MFIMWIFTLIVAQSLSLRKGFLHRFAVAVLVIGVSILPFIAFRSIGGLDRIGLVGEVSVGLGHPNGLAAWFGFCCVYFGILGLESRRGPVRIASWLIAAACLLVVGLTVSRGALLGVGLAGTVAFRRLLKRGFIPLLILILLGGFLALSGIFERSMESYMERGMEETGRGEVWPVAAQRFLESPLTGFGVSDIGTPIPGKQKVRSPHNSFLAVGLAAGIIPLAFFIGYWWRAARGAYRLQSQRADFAPFYFPLFIYAFVDMMLSNYPFLISWVVFALAAPLAASARPVRHVIGRMRRGWRTGRVSATPEVTRHPAHLRFDAPRKLS
jgi:O-antigen ligase